ncbi:SMP-30/gluconolactonase/LRE family protein [Pseudomonadales bacterium]|jgi:gluconolactonase|nr:SMP-30/gluconolactonase/LRE family protein [Gammaproteobacteria bacterium]MDA0825171.1 SMP-30/gluconolactonase/LRE family protein [Pseudomonadota bacterium]MDA8627341.1 SMP-30/gluconolactonase/LRE family protein [Pseudomonadales bacterium]MBT7885901.1 SMP-30/gluconolactonase/LRE family protein [Gammaproteobacteria bacterium]MCO4831895.1 SMP-30/gluconolactonase/LRE family protein [Gammaproteobacteria bacterium]
MDVTVMTQGLAFPEGPVALSDGAVLVVEIQRGTLTRVAEDGTQSIVAELGGGPNGAALGPDGHCYICNNGGFEWHKGRDGRVFPGEQPANYTGGRIERVDLKTGAVETLYEACNGERLKGPNDLVFDQTGGFWFTDHGKTSPRTRDRTGVFYAAADGSRIEEVIFPMEAPNGIGLSPDEKTLYVAETPTGRLWAYAIASPGALDVDVPRRMLAQRPDFHMFDSLAVDASGNVCVATLITGGITSHSPDGSAVEFFAMPDVLTTNIAFGGEDLQTAYITLSSTGKLIKATWPTPGLRLNFQA